MHFQEWQMVIGDINTVMIALFGISITKGLGDIIKYLFKIAKEKSTENTRNKEAFDKMMTDNGKQETRLNNLEVSQNLLIQSQLATLHNQIFNKADEYINRGWITLTELDNFNMVYTAYEQLDGNGTGHTLHEKVNNLPQKESGILSEEELS